jgi:predicted AAA+ superfamily ATPase
VSSRGSSEELAGRALDSKTKPCEGSEVVMVANVQRAARRLQEIYRSRIGHLKGQEQSIGL